ncbi:MAG: iron-containing alcohol dehydrogenase [Thermoguttaceae bacterium]|nr:iron-containing alcohol dehydrogenase [Thermoguttaceae bacterium]
MLEKYLNLNDVKEIRARSLIYFGCGAIQKVADVARDMKARGVDRVIVVSSPSAYKKCGAWPTIIAAFEAAGVEYVLFDKNRPNPEVEAIDEALKVAVEFGAQGVVGIGGGSPIDAAKSVAILLKNPGKTAEDLYSYSFAPTEAAPILAINLTHGTGTEGNRVAVASIPAKQHKPAIAYECIYPTWSIDDPELMKTLPKTQILYTSVDALNHAVEAATTTCSNPLAITLARETVKLVVDYLPAALENPEDMVARYNLAYAALIAGISFDNGFLHYTHALEHPLSGVNPDVIHGCGLGVLLPAVLKEIYPKSAAVLADVLAPIVPGLKGCACEAEEVAKSVEKWLFSVGANRKLTEEGFGEADVSKLVDLVFSTPSLTALLAVAPTEATRETVEKIYRESLAPMN